MSPRSRGTAGGAAALSAALLTSTLLPVVAVQARASEVPLPALVSANPADWTPDVLDGDVRSTATVGGVTVAVGDFTRVRERSTGTTVERSDIVAFDGSGVVLTTFDPQFVGTALNDVVPAGDGTSVFVGGSFSRVDGMPDTDKVVRLDVTTGEVLSTFRSPGFDQRVTDLELRDGRLYVGGWFTTVGGQPRSALVALDPDSGADAGVVDLRFEGTQNGGTTGVSRMSVAPDGSWLVAVGNFRTVEGEPRPQLAVVDLSGAAASLSPWATDRYAKACSPGYDSYVTDVDIAPDGSYFVVVTTGGYYGGSASGTLCDTVARWELDGGGSGQDPVWVDWTGGDTVTAVLATGRVVYVGGHFRWMNNPFGNNSVGPGGVHRRGLAALDARNGLPLSWNPERATGWGVARFRASADGLWIAHDTEMVGGEVRKRLALMPLARRATLPREATGALPGRVYQLGSPAGRYDGRRVLYRVNAGGPLVLSNDGGPDWQADTSTSPSPLHTWGSVSATWNRAFGRAVEVPRSTPQAVFTTERADPWPAPEMSWDFPVRKGTAIRLRLFFASGCGCTTDPGDRVFDVDVDGVTRLDDYDPVAAAGHAVGTVEAIDLVSDGNVDVDFTHVVENPLVNAIEVIRTDAPRDPDPHTSRVTMRRFDGGSVTRSVRGPITREPTDWAGVRGAFMVDDRLYTGSSDGRLIRWVHDRGVFRRGKAVNLHGLVGFSNDLMSARALFYDRRLGRMYFTQAGETQLFYRYFTPESEVVGSIRYAGPESTPSLPWDDIRGAFLAGGRLYVTTSWGTMRTVAWRDGSPTGRVTTVSGPRLDGVDWRARATFLLAG